MWLGDVVNEFRGLRNCKRSYQEQYFKVIGLKTTKIDVSLDTEYIETVIIDRHFL